MTGTTLITDALTEIGVLAEGEAASAAMVDLGLARLNQLIDRWKTQNLAIPLIQRVTKALTNGTASYTIGTGGNIDVERPELIQAAGIVDTTQSPQVEYPLGDVLTVDEYAKIPLKTLSTSWVERIYYEPTFPLGRIYVFPIPNVSTLTLALYLGVPIAVFDKSTTVTVKPAVEAALLYNLALALCRPFGKPVTPDLMNDAAQSLGDMKRSNIRLVDLASDAADIWPGTNGRGSSDIYSGP